MEQGDGIYFYWQLPLAEWTIFRHFDPMLPSYAIHSVIIPTELQFCDAVVHDKGYNISFCALDLAVWMTWGSSWCSVFSFWSCVIWHIQLPNPGLVVYMVAPLSQWTQCSSCKRLVSWRSYGFRWISLLTGCRGDVGVLGLSSSQFARDNDLCTTLGR